MVINWIVLLASSFIPLVVGAVYYGPLFGKAWMNVNGFKDEDLEGSNMALIFGLSILLSFLIAFALAGMTIHQSGVLQLLASDLQAGSAEAKATLESFMAVYGEKHMDFGHGALHGTIAAVLFAFPLVAINSLFERRGWKYIGIHFGFWLISLTLMSGVICHFW